MAQHLPELGDVLAEGGDGLRRLAAGQLPQEQRRHHRDDEEHAGDAEQQRVILREARPALAQDQPDQRGHAEHDHPGDGRHEAEQAGAAAVVQAAADQIHPRHADDAVAHGRDPVADQEGDQDRPAPLRPQQEDDHGKDRDGEAHDEVRPGEPPLFPLHPHQVAGHEQLGQHPADVEQAAGQADQDFGVGQAADEVGDDRRRADDTHGHREGDGIDQEQTEVAPVSGFALGGGERPRARIGHGCPAG